MDISRTHARDRFAQKQRPGAFDIIERNVHQDIEFIAEFFKKRKVQRFDLLAAHADLQRLGDDLRKGNDGSKSRRTSRFEPVVPVRELLHPVHHAHGDFPAARGTKVIMVYRLFWREGHAAGAVSVVMVFPFLRKELYGAEKSLFRLDGIHHGEIGYLRIKYV